MSKKRKKHQRIITTYSNENMPFVAKKLRTSLEKAGADKGLSREIFEKIKELESVSSTKDIHSVAFEYLKKKNRPVAARYNLKRAIAELGPTGFPFERFVGEILKRQGYSVEIGKVVSGKCVEHEIDIVAKKKNSHIMVECKFHNKHWIKSHIQTALYVKARFDDVKKSWVGRAGHGKKFHQAWIVTNTKLTDQAISYAECSGIKVVSWNYPKNGSLANIIDSLGLHPITALTSLNKKHKQSIVENGVILCQDVLDKKPLLRKVGLSESKINQVMEESRAVCGLSQM